MAKLSIDQKLVEHIAHLAKLKLSPEEVPQLVKYMQQIIGYVETLNEVDTKNCQPFYGPIMDCEKLFQEKLSSSFASHQDTVQPFEHHQAILSNAPKQEEGQYKIKAIIEEQ